MPVRGDLSGRAGLGAADAGKAEAGAMATESVAACICPGLRRQYAIESLPSRGLRTRPGSQNSLSSSRTERPTVLPENLRFRARSLRLSLIFSGNRFPVFPDDAQGRSVT